MRRMVTLLSVLVVLAAGCSSSGGGGGGTTQDPNTPPEEPVKIRMGWTIPGEEIKYLMMEDPSLAPNMGTWYEIEWFQLQNTPTQIQQMAAGTLDAGSVGSLTVANGIDQGADFVITGQFLAERPGYGAVTWLVKKDSGIESVADLKGTTVGVNGIGAYVDYVGDYLLSEKGGLEPDRDVKKAELPFSKMQEAIASGQISTGPLVPPFLTKAMGTGQFRPLFSTLDALPGGSIPILQAFTRKFVEEHPVTVKKFMEDWATVAEWMAKPENRKKTIQATSAATQIPAKVLDSYLFTKNDFYRPPKGAVDTEGLQENWDFFRQQGAFSSSLKVEDYINPDLLPNAAT